MDVKYQKAFSFASEKPKKSMPSTDLPDKRTSTLKPIEIETPVEEKTDSAAGPDFSYFMNNKVVLPITGDPVDVPDSSKPKQKKRKTSLTGVVTENDVETNEFGEIPYEKKYEETTNLLKTSVAQLDAGLMELQNDVNQIRASKTLKRKYDYLSMLQGTMGQYIGTKVSALREINSTITKCNELELKRAKELHAQQGEENIDKKVMDMYSAFISMPTDGGSPLGPTVNQLTYSPSITGAMTNVITGETSEEAGYQNYLNNMSPSQRLSLYENDPNVQQVVVYDNRTNTKRFEVMNIATGEIIPNVDKRDMMFMDDTVIDLENHVARNINLNETYPVIEVGDRLADAY